MNLSNINSMFNTWLFYFKMTCKGIYLWIIFRSLQVWYFIFTPKNAKYIDDVPLLHKARINLDTWILMASASLFMKGGTFR